MSSGVTVNGRALARNGDVTWIVQSTSAAVATATPTPTTAANPAVASIVTLVPTVVAGSPRLARVIR